MSSKVVLTQDHPGANGRTPQSGDREYSMTFTLEDGSVLTVKMGEPGWQIITNMMVDMLAESPSYDDGSVPSSKVSPRTGD